MGYLFGDILAVNRADLLWIWIGGGLVLAALARLWQPLLAMAVNEELAAAEGVPREAMTAAFVLLLAIAIAITMKIVGILLAIAFLIMPATAARPLSSTPESMAALAALAGVVAVVLGLTLSSELDSPGGPSIVLVMALIAGASLMAAAVRQRLTAR
jgi:zinc transport system permease protein